MELKRLMIVTGKKAIEILEVIEHAQRLVKEGSKRVCDEEDNDSDDIKR